MSNQKILSRFNEEQIHHIKGLTSSKDVLAYAKQVGVSITNIEAVQVCSEVEDGMLENVNGGAQFGHGNRGSVYRK